MAAVGLVATAAEPEAVQLGESGPYWATVNVGTPESHDPAYPAEYGALCKFNGGEAKNAAEGLDEGGATNGVKFVWNAAADLPAGFKAGGVSVKVTAEK